MSLPDWRSKLWRDYTEPSAPWFRLLEEIVGGQPDDIAANRAGLLHEDLLYVLSLALDPDTPHPCWTEWHRQYLIAVGERTGEVVNGMGPSPERTRVLAPSVAQRAETPAYVPPASPEGHTAGASINLVFRDPRPDAPPPLPPRDVTPELPSE